MVLLRVNLLGGFFSLVFGVINVAVKIVYKVLELFHLRLLFIALVTGGVLELFFDKLSGDPTALLIFLTVLAILAVRSVYLNLKKYVFGAFTSKKEKKADKNAAAEQPQYVQGGYPPQGYAQPYAQPQYPPQYVQPQPMPVKEVKNQAKPVYYRVSQNPKYIMAEYADRYELFYEESTGLKYIKTDYKSDGGNGYD